MSELPNDNPELNEAIDSILPGVTPGAVLEAMDDPEAFAVLARGDLYVQMALMRTLATHPDFPAGQRIDYVKFLAKMGKVDAPDREADRLANVPGINIIFNDGQSVKIGVEKDVTPPPSDDRKLQSKAVIP